MKKGKKMNLSIKKLFSLILIYKISFLTGLATAQTTYSERKTEPVISDIQFIMDNEQFILKEIYFDGYENNIRNCVFESPSTIWTIEYCHFGKKDVEGYWSWTMAGELSIKNTNIKLPYYIERGYRSVYRDIEQGPAFLDKPSRISMSIQTDVGFRVDINWTAEKLPFLQTMARMQEQLIKQSMATNITESEAILSDIESIMNNEQFVLSGAHFSSSEDSASNCVFESPSATWTIHYCHIYKNLASQEKEVDVLTGEFSIKNTNIKLPYSLRHRKSNIYRNIEQGSIDFKDLSYILLREDETSKIGIDWFETQLPFIQTLARTQEQLIEQSLTDNPPETY